jgi:hypothetical protein
MSAIYTINDGESIVIGGTSETGPFPKYGMSRDTVELGDGTPIGNKYSITLTGVILTDSSGDVSISGDMQSKLHEKIITKLRTNISLGHNVGMLEIVPYGGQPNPIIFLDAKLLSINIPEQSDDSSGILYSEYTFTFEATEELSNDEPSLFPYSLKSAEESWQITEDQEVSFSPNAAATPYKTYTITHNISATGNKKFVGISEFYQSAWKQAADWCKSRLVSSPAVSILVDAIGNDEITSFSPVNMDETSGVGSPDLSGYLFYNHVRLPSPDLTGGSYTISETWKASKVPAVLDLEVSVAQDESENNTVTLSGSITGLDTTPVNNPAINKLANAETVLQYIDSSAYTLCNTYYNVPGGTLQSVVRSKTIGRNKGSGTISFSYSFNDIPVLIDNAISTNLNFIDDNEYRLNKVIAVIPIIGKPDGPIIQDMGTTTERRRTVQLDAVMKKNYRTVRPAQPVSIVLGYKPEGTVYLQSLVENWDPTSGAYGITAEWTY